MFEPKSSAASRMVLDALWCADGVWRVSNFKAGGYHADYVIFDDPVFNSGEYQRVREEMDKQFQEILHRAIRNSFGL